ncbi:hypothetical protein [Pontibacter rugosus]|uniref:STAS/SEC14 domain-containing protein n=1 Tax=Pontibacter rugosus TaxID=1745966 RepID=A0ABW3STJ4_9BACT
MHISDEKTEFTASVAAWPAPLELKQQNGEVFVTLLQHDNYIEAKWTGHITANDVITACKAYLEVIQRHPCPGMLNNKSEVTGDWAEANDWIEFEWLPKAMYAGLRCLAHIYSSNMFSRLSARDLYLRVTPRLQMKNFMDHDTAIHWIQTHLTSTGEETQPAPQV